MEKEASTVSVGNLVVVAVGVTAAVLLGVWGMLASSTTDLRTELGRVEDTLRTELGRMEDTLRTELGKVDDNVGALRTDVTKIAEDVGYLRGRMDERDMQRTAD